MHNFKYSSQYADFRPIMEHPQAVEVPQRVLHWIAHLRLLPGHPGLFFEELRLVESLDSVKPPSFPFHAPPLQSDWPLTLGRSSLLRENLKLSINPFGFFYLTYEK